MMNKKLKKDDFKDVKTPFELMDIYENEPEPVFYWRGIEDVSFGYVFGPSKAGKTIFCENLAISLAIGRKEFFNSPMIGKPKKVFLVSMEENYRNRIKRLKNQIKDFSNEEKKLLNDNLILAGMTFPRSIINDAQFIDLENQIVELKPKVVIIDSFTRIMNDDITNRMECKKILMRLRNFAYDNSICLVVIHHSTKTFGRPLTMDSMAGSSVMSQEADFSIGINHNEITRQRYFKEVFYRYLEPNELVMNFDICNETNWLQPIGFKPEMTIVNNTGIESGNYFEMIIAYLEDKSDKMIANDNSIKDFDITVSELKKEFVSSNTMPSRSFDYTLRKIVNNGFLTPNGKMGNYLYNIDNMRNLRNERNK